MPLSTDVKLPRDYEAIFPDYCVGCQGETFRNKIKVSTRDFSWSQLIFWFMIGKKKSVEVPVCEACAMRLKFRRWGSGLAALFLIAICWFFLFDLTDQLPRSLRKFAVLGLILICSLPLLAWEVFWPRDFDISANKHTLTYEFKSEDVAIEFHELNSAVEWSEID